MGGEQRACRDTGPGPGPVAPVARCSPHGSLLEEKAKRADCCAEASEARDHGMVKTKQKIERLFRTLTMTLPIT